MMAGVQIESAFFANHAEVRDSLLFASGAYPEYWTLPELPGNTALTLVLVVRLEIDENDREFTWSVTASSPRGEATKVGQINTKRGGVLAEDGSPLYQIIAAPLVIEFKVAGLHSFTITGRDGRPPSDAKPLTIGPASIQLGIRTPSK